MRELIEIVGSERFIESTDLLEDFSKDMSFAPRVRPRCVVVPESAEEVKRIVEWANKTFTPLLPISSGPPRFRGDTVPSVGGVVIVDLSKMRRVIRIDRKNKVVILEPGVTFSELIPALAKEDLAPFMPLATRSTKSVVTSALETEPIITPKYHWEAQDPLACAEVIFGNGELFRTGDAVGPGDLEEQWKVGKAQSRGIGPAYVDFSKLLQCAQGSIGIVTWASIYCRPLPKMREVFFITTEDLERLIELVYKLMWRRLGDVCSILNNCNFACLLSSDSEKIQELRGNVPSWILVFTIEPTGLFPYEKMEYQKAEFINLARSFGLIPTSVIHEMRAEDVIRVIEGVSPEPYWKLRLRGGCQELFFLTTMDKVAWFIKKFCELASLYKYPTMNLGVYIQPIQQGTCCHCEFDLYYNPQVMEEVEATKKIFYEGARMLIRSGAFFARPYGSLKDITYPYVSAPFIIVQRKIKAIFDPNNIMNPGKIYF